MFSKDNADYLIKSSWACAPLIKHEKVGGAGLPARQAVRTGWKACATGRTFRQIQLSRRIFQGNNGAEGEGRELPGGWVNSDRLTN
jgi:hypothetical protein